jgi:hypothetical protein
MTIIIIIVIINPVKVQTICHWFEDSLREILVLFSWILKLSFSKVIRHETFDIGCVTPGNHIGNVATHKFLFELVASPLMF